MSEWKETTLADLCTDISYGYTESAKQEKVGPKFLRITDIASGWLEWDKVPYCLINESDFEKYKLLPGDIVIARTGATTGANYTIKESDPKDVVFASYLIRYKINPQIAYPYYIGQLLKSPNWSDYVDAIAGGSAQPGANAKQLGSFDIILPPLPEQKAIASILSSLDDKIDLLHRQNATLEKMGETLFRQWFVEDAKEEWESGRVGDLIRILSGFAFKSSSFVESGKYRLITIKGVQDGYLELTNSDRIDELPEQMPEFCKLQIGDILLSLTGNVGRCCLVDTTYLLLNQRVAKLHPIKERDKAFTYFLFRQPQIKQLLEEMAKGTAQANLSPVETSNMELKIPDNNTLNEFSSLVTPWVEKLIFNKKSIQTLTQIRDFLLPKLMSGEVAVEMA